MKEKIQKYREYLDYIEEHYDNVQKAWKLIKDKCGNKFRFIYDDFVFGLIESNIVYHDLSKLSQYEFTQYAQYWFPCSDEVPNKEIFNKGWEHHKEVNFHHYQNWMQFQNNPYIDIQIVEMICDWVAMGFKFNETAREYYDKNKEEINLPEFADKLVNDIFDCIY